MKWYKHFTLKETPEKKLLMKWGAKGYGLYYYCIDIIAGRLTSDNITFDLEDDSELLAYQLKIDSKEVEDIIKDCINWGLFEYNQTTSKVACHKLLNALDISTSNNPEFKKLLDGIKDYKELLDTNSRREENTIEENRIEIEENKGNEPLLLSSLDTKEVNEEAEEIEKKLPKPSCPEEIATEMMLIASRWFPGDIVHPETKYWINVGKVESEKMFDHYQANGWKQSNGNLIKDYRACIRNWMRRHKEYKGVIK